jgi:nucleotide-binding universal stress UspA family protein
MNVKRILFPTDFSECAEQALDHALLLAEDFDAELHMLHAVVLHQADPANPDLQFTPDLELLDRLEKVAKTRLAELAEGRARQVRVRQVERRGFSAPVAILEYADEIAADLIVMGTHGHRGAARFFLGSVAEQVVRHAPCPVLTLRGRDSEAPLEGVQAILVPVDFSEHSRGALATAAELAARWQARLELVHVLELPPLPAFYGPVPDVGSTQRLVELSDGELRKLTEELVPEAVEHSFTTLEGGAATEIVRHARDSRSDLIVISSHGRSGLDRLLLGSTTERVVRMADCPVLTLRPAAQSES